MVCIDIVFYGMIQVQECEDILNVGGFFDSVFDVIIVFVNGNMSVDYWVGQIEGVEIQGELVKVDKVGMCVGLYL